MIVKINSIPKSGTHLLVRATELLGAVVENCGHMLYEHADPQSNYLFIIRNPRNTLISSMRSKHKPLTQGAIIASLQSYDEDVVEPAYGVYRKGKTFHEHMVQYAPWLTARNALVVRFEELLDDPRTLRRVADYLGVDYLDDAYQHLRGPTSTYTGRLSRWQDHWTPLVESAWVGFGGIEVERMLGY